MPKRLGTGTTFVVYGAGHGWQERPEHHMNNTRVEIPRVTCGTCRKFDGIAWCRHWNFRTTAESPPCRSYTRMK